MFAYTAPNSGAVAGVHREPDRIPAVALRDRLAEQLDIVVAAPTEQSLSSGCASAQTPAATAPQAAPLSVRVRVDAWAQGAQL